MTLTIVQSAQKSYNATDTLNPEVTFGSAPTLNNLLIAICMSQSSPPFTTGSGWTQITATSGGAQNIAAFYKYAGSSESVTQTPNTKQTNQWTVMAWEISGVSGVAANDIAAGHVFDLVTNYPGTSGTPTSFNTAHNSELVLFAASGNATASGTTFSSSFGTSDNSLPGTVVDGLGTFEVGNGWHQTEATAGTAFQPTITSSNSANMSYAAVELVTPTGNTETGTAVFDVNKVSFSVTVNVIAGTAIANMTLGKVSIAANALDLQAIAKLRQFQTFG